MRNMFKGFLHQTKSNGETIGLPFLVAGIVTVIVEFGLVVSGSEVDITLLGASFGLISVGLGLIAIGASAKSDKRYTELLKRLDRNITRLPTMFKGDALTLSGQQMAKEAEAKVREQSSEQSKIATQKRLDEDTKKVGYVRGELFQNKDGSWSIGWGGKYPL